MQREPYNRKQKKIAKVFKAVISAGLIAPAFVSVSSCSEAPVEREQQEESLSQSPEAPFSGLEIEGLNPVFQNGKWEYIDPSDGSVAGYWDEKEGKYEHTADVLRGEWSGLFVSQSLEETRSQLAEDENWSAGNWNDGEIKVPVPFNIVNGGVIEEIKALGNFIRGSKTGKVLGIRELPNGTVIFSPITQEEISFSVRWSDNFAGFDLVKGSIFLSFDFKKTSQCLIPDNGYPDNPYNGLEYVSAHRFLSIGDPLLEVNTNDFLPKISTALVNPFLSKDYQVLLTSIEKGEGPINFSFENLLRDGKGRFIFINPDSKEVEVMRETIEEEIKKTMLEEEKNVLEEKLEEPSIIDQEKRAPNIEGLEFDKDSGFYIARENNNYGLAEEEKAGAFTDGFLSLKPGVIKVLQDETKKYSFPIPINPSEGKIKIAETVEKMFKSTVLMIDVSEEMTVYSPKEAFFYQFEQHGGQGSKGIAFVLPNEIEETRELEIRSNNFEYLVDDDVNVGVGKLLAKTDQDIVYELYLGGHSVNIMDYILKIDDIPVFILPNE